MLLLRRLRSSAGIRTAESPSAIVAVAVAFRSRSEPMGDNAGIECTRPAQV